MPEESSLRPAFPRRHELGRTQSVRGVIRPIYAAVFDLDPAGYKTACDVVLNWLRTHPTLGGHGEGLLGVDFELNHSIQSGLVAQSARSADGNVIVIRLQHREKDRYTSKLDPLRNWRTEATIERSEGTAWVATRQWFAGLETDFRESQPPRFIRELWDRKALSDLDILVPRGRTIEFEQEADEIAELIGDYDRDLPVVVIADGCPLDHGRVASESTGLAHVVKLTRAARLRLVANLGGGFELSHGALQTFYPRFKGQDVVAPAARFETIVAWQFASLVGPAAFAKWLHNELGRAIVTRLVNDPAHRSYEEIRTQAIQSQQGALAERGESVDVLRESLQLSNELRELLELENEDLQKQIAETTDRAQTYFNEKSLAEEAYRKEIDRNQRLQLDKAALLERLNAKAGSDNIVWDAPRVESLIADQPDPQTTFDAVEQARRLFAIYGLPVRISEEAEEGAMEALAFKRPADVQAALIRLGFRWNEIRGSGQRLDKAATEGLRFPSSMFESETTMRLYGKQRVVRVDGVPVVLQKHIKLGGGGADESARIYFGDKDGEILIGHVGRHLDVAGTQ